MIRGKDAIKAPSNITSDTGLGQDGHKRQNEANDHDMEQIDGIGDATEATTCLAYSKRPPCLSQATRGTLSIR